jgi:hypothetical protein
MILRYLDLTISAIRSCIATSMSLTIPQASQSGLFKPGYNSYDAEDGAVIRNVRTPRVPHVPLLHYLLS